MKATELSFRVVLFMWLCKLILPFNPRMYKGQGGGEGWHNVFLSLFLKDKTSVPVTVHSSLMQILRQV